MGLHLRGVGEVLKTNQYYFILPLGSRGEFMGRTLSVFFLCLFLFTACSKTPDEMKSSVAPEKVDVKKVASILTTENATQLSLCRSEVLASNASILYENENGVLFTDKPVKALGLRDCQANALNNEPIKLTPGPSIKPGELSTLLRLIPAEEMGARSFVKANPTYDGRKVTIAILDTGIELDHPMLTKTSEGLDKIIDFQDFSGEGRVEVTKVQATADTITGTDANQYSVKGIPTSDIRFGVFQGSGLKADAKLGQADTFADVGVIAYQAADQSWLARIDTNDDKSFADEIDLTDYKISRKFTKLGKRKSLTTTVNMDPTHSLVNLNFDDGAHGTHVAGIAAGFDPAGLQGVAPGAQIICGKMGDNRLSGGATTTASMILAIDFAVANHAQITNMSYGMRAGSNLGKSTIDRYVDRVARKSGMIFSISAGNEGPGLLTIGTPAGASLAIVNAAYLSKETAQTNFGYIGVDEGRPWFFSSVGPLFDGGWRPSLLAPGTALSSVPGWNDGGRPSVANFSGTSMASPEVTGALALLVSGALQAGLPTDRVAVTQAVYAGATLLPNVTLIEQGHGLMNVPASFNALEKRKAIAPIEYQVAISGTSSPDGKGAGIFVHSRQLPSQGFSAVITPIAKGAEAQRVKTYHVAATAPWIKVPDSFWLQSDPNPLQIDLDPSVLSAPGLHSERIVAMDDHTKLIAFEIPVTVLSPVLMNEANHYTYSPQDPIKVGQTRRYFIDVPQGTTGARVEVTTTGTYVFAQLSDPEGRKVLELHPSDPQPPMDKLFGQVNLNRPGVYELDVTALPTRYNVHPGTLSAKVQLFSLTATLGPKESDTTMSVMVQNNFGVLKVIPKVELNKACRKISASLEGEGGLIPFAVSDEDKKVFSGLDLRILTSKTFYDMMTDYPYTLTDAKGNSLASGGAELDTKINVGGFSGLPTGNLQLSLSGSFALNAPDKWMVEIEESRQLKNPVTIESLPRVILNQGQSTEVRFDMENIQKPITAGMDPCPELTLSSPEGNLLQSIPLWK
jgi:subtilisin family serine protease